jgi:hypothetical protein
LISAGALASLLYAIQKTMKRNNSQLNKFKYGLKIDGKKEKLSRVYSNRKYNLYNYREAKVR